MPSSSSSPSLWADKPYDLIPTLEFSNNVRYDILLLEDNTLLKAILTDFTRRKLCCNTNGPSPQWHHSGAELHLTTSDSNSS